MEAIEEKKGDSAEKNRGVSASAVVVDVFDFPSSQAVQRSAVPLASSAAKKGNKAATADLSESNPQRPAGRRPHSPLRLHLRFFETNQRTAAQGCQATSSEWRCPPV